MEIIKAGYLGPEGTYSSLAAKKLCPDAELITYPSFFTLFAALKDGEVDAVVTPIENTLNGAVTQNLDLLQETPDIYACAACAVKIEHRLITLDGADINGIKHVWSHPQALGQCAKFLARNYPFARLHETASTAECIDKLKSAEDAGIVGEHCAREGYTLSEESIADEPKNYTQFLLIRNGEPSEKAFSDRIFFSVTCRHKVGALVELLEILRDCGINMTEIESRPIKSKTGEFRFFIEVEGNYSLPETRAALDRLKSACKSFKLFGCYVCGLPKDA
ncbi:MAG: hypothetical protein K2L72_02230 [Clostridia bacterium]|nr:hypothetical protein [Clostridia bacterium]